VLAFVSPRTQLISFSLSDASPLTHKLVCYCRQVASGQQGLLLSMVLRRPLKTMLE